MRIVTFNIHHGTLGRRGRVDGEQLADVCAGFDADVICLQEVDRSTLRTKGVDLASVVATRCEMAHRFGSSQRLLGGLYGNAVLVKGEIAKSTVVRLPKVPRTRFWQEQRTVLETDVVVQGRQISVWCTHLAVKQWNNEPQLNMMLQRASGHDGPLIIAGDLNRRRDAVVRQAAAAGLAVVDGGATFPVGKPHLDIDHVLYCAHWTVKSHEVRQTPMSDHCALVVDLDYVGSLGS